MAENFFESLSQIIQPIIHLESTGILTIIIVLGIAVFALKIIMKISKIIQFALISGIIILIIIWIVNVETR